MAPALGRLAILGERALIGAHLAATVDGALAVGRQRLDWSSGAPDVESLELAEAGCTHAVLAAGITGVGACEAEPELSRRVNVDAVVHMARRLREEGIAPIAFSSDYVFDGRAAPYSDDAPRAPLNVYGRQKAERQRELEDLGGVLVLRLSKVYTRRPGDGTLLDEIAALLRAEKPVRAAHDQRFNPIAIEDVAASILALAAGEETGVVNVCGPQAWCRLDLARAIAEAIDADPDLIQEISLDDLDEPFERPKDTRMTTERLCGSTDARPEPTERAIAELARR